MFEITPLCDYINSLAIISPSDELEALIGDDECPHPVQKDSAEGEERREERYGYE